MNGSITDVEGITVGHWSDERAVTGCTVVLLPRGARAGVCVNGSAPATRETPVVSPASWVEEVHAICLSGGSAFGLDAAGGVMGWLAERDIGHPTRFAPVPIVPAACIYDLNRGDPKVRPGPREGWEACAAATRHPASGPVGAGTGATCGKWRGIDIASPSGIGMASARSGEVTVGALAVASPVGDIVDENGSVIAGADRGPADRGGPDITNTVLVVVATDAIMDRTWCHRAAARIPDGIARAVMPAHTLHDGDVGFFVSAGETLADADIVFHLTATTTAEAIRNAAR